MDFRISVHWRYAARAARTLGAPSRARYWRCCSCIPTSRSAPSGSRWRCGARTPPRAPRRRAGARLAAAQGARRRRDPRPRRRPATACASARASSTPSASSGWSSDGRSALAAGRRRGGGGAAARGAELWRGPPLADLGVRAVRAGRDRAARGAAAGRARGTRRGRPRRGPARRAGRELQRLVAEHPTRERLAGAADARALPLRAPGRGARGLPRARRVLVEELGIEPGPELRGLQEAILPRIRRSTADARRELPAGSTSAAAPRRRPRRRARLVARALGRRARGAGAVVAVVGRAGIGKTRLAAELAGGSTAAGGGALRRRATAARRPSCWCSTRPRGAARPTLARCSTTPTARARAWRAAAELARVDRRPPVLDARAR